MKHRQGGMTLIGFLITLTVIGFAAYIAMKLFPMYQEYYAIRSAAKGLAQQSGVGEMDPMRLEDLMQRRLDASYSDTLRPENIKFDRVDGGWKMHIAYEVRKPLVYNLDVVGKFDFTQDLGRGGGGER